MSERSEWIDKLTSKYRSRVSYTKAKINVNIASQIKALRRRRDMKQIDLAREAEMRQSRISAIERPGASGLTVETLVRLASAFRVGLIIKFVPFSEMLRWDNSFCQDLFEVTKIDEDIEFIKPELTTTSLSAMSFGSNYMNIDEEVKRFIFPYSQEANEEMIAAGNTFAMEIPGVTETASQPLLN
jgi:transcriptional regulator with XRE-family HTH domain